MTSHLGGFALHNQPHFLVDLQRRFETLFSVLLLTDESEKEEAKSFFAVLSPENIFLDQCFSFFS